ncbi:hypothetical protein C9374_014580 [Naegleria lovaniensis]|uniref:Dolichyl-diphosphooligosaccharide--protein glycosyltransferase subunit 2 n=1 Tax=Naegleria lovaniensis TaxID=51637 RepID=A0AA88GUL1_NAELO|nr:uncharacterized protein C9374_014580 [Naegleria lovaniensis]KAG2389180.1 hypothetical protein C9374_014580 [Naegleria lovaniensis]
MASLRKIYFGIVVVLACLAIFSVSIFALSVRNGLTTLDKQNIQSLIGDLNSKQSKKDLFFAASSLSKIGKEVPTIQSKCVQSLTTVDNPNDLYFTIAANVALKCAPLSAESYGLVQSALAKFIDGATENTISAETIYSITRILLLTKSKINTKDVKTSKLSDIITKQLSSLLKQDCSGDCVKSVGFLLESAAILQGIEKSDLSALNNAIDNISSVVKKAVSSTSVEVAAVFSRGLNKIAGVVAGLDKKISENDISALIESLVSKKESAKSLNDIYHLVEGLQSFAGKGIYETVVVSELKDEKGVYSISASNLLGSPLNEKVTLQSVYKGSNSDDSILPKGPVKLESSNGVDFQMKNIKLTDTGSYNFDISVGKTTVTRTLKTAAVDLKIRDFQLDIGKLTRSQISYPNPVPEKLVVDVDSNTRIRVSFSLAGVTPHQVFLRVGNDVNEAIFNIKQQYQASYGLDLALERVIGGALKLQSGDYQIQIIIGDATLNTPILWTVATTSLNFSKQYEKSEEEALYEVKPVITHIFRPPEKRAGSEIASLFSLIVLVPLALYLIGTLAVGFNFRGCPGGLSGLLAPVLVALLAATIGILVMYFISWNIFETLKYLGIVGIAMLLVGSKVLRGVAQKRTAQ